MLLDDYYRAVHQDHTTRTRSKLTLRPLLSAALQALGQVSEQQIREWAMPLQFNAHTDHLATGAPWRGQRTGVLWPENVVLNVATVGTVHTHPYAKKLSPDAKVGFSIGDLSFYAQMQGGAPIKVHFVVCCRTVFLAVYRIATQVHLANDQWAALEGDEQACEDLAVRHLMRDGRTQPQARMAYEVRMLAALEADQAGNIDLSGQLERQFFSEIPGYVALRSAANDQMIRRAASVLRFELYRGPVGGTLHLKSNRLYYSGGIKGVRQRVFG